MVTMVLELIIKYKRQYTHKTLKDILDKEKAESDKISIKKLKVITSHLVNRGHIEILEEDKIKGLTTDYVTKKLLREGELAIILLDVMKRSEANNKFKYVEMYDVV
jgi:hypothetical protein